jgi:protein-S-isoprenylcysteine O-methyltransferase Ste14
MDKELEFRIAAAAVFLLMIAIRLHFLRGTDRAGDMRESRKRPVDRFLLISLGTLWMVALAVYVIYPPLISWAALGLPPWARWIGLGAGCAMLALFAWAHAAIGKFFSFSMRTIEGHKLITSGPYHWVRHPIYTVFMGFGVAYLLLCSNWLVGLCWLGGAVIIAACRVKTEEAVLIAKFGDQYRAYIKTTGRFFPRLWR